MKKGSFFERFSKQVACASGSPAAFIIALGMVIVWLISGPLFGYSDTWQLVINTSTTIITFLMVFIIQHTQNKDTMAMQLKLDELLRAVEGAEEALIDLEEIDDDELQKVRKRFLDLAAQSRKKAEGPISDNLVGNHEETPE